MRTLIALAAMLMLAGSAAAVTISVHGASTANVDVSFSVVDSTIIIEETWNTNGFLFLEFDELSDDVFYTIEKRVTNNTGTDWSSFSMELLDPLGDDNDALDPTPYPGYVPTGFSTSNNSDFLTFSPGSLAPTSVAFDEVMIDVFTDERDFLDFYDGTVSGAGGIDTLIAGLNDSGDNDPFLLAQTPNAPFGPIIPEPATLALVGLGMAGLAARRRRRG